MKFRNGQDEEVNWRRRWVHWLQAPCRENFFLLKIDTSKSVWDMCRIDQISAITRHGKRPPTADIMLYSRHKIIYVQGIDNSSILIFTKQLAFSVLSCHWKAKWFTLILERNTTVLVEILKYLTLTSFSRSLVLLTTSSLFIRRTSLSW